MRDREDALDASQDVFLRVLHSIDRFSVGKPLWPWLRKVTTTTCLNRIRSKASRPETVAWEDVSNDSDSASHEVSPETAAEIAWDRERVSQALAKLPAIQRVIVVLRHEEDLTYEQIADLTGLPLGTVKTHLFRARQRLRDMLMKEVGT